MSRRILLLLFTCIFLLIAAAETTVFAADSSDRAEGRAEGRAKLEFFGAKELLPARMALMEGRYEEAVAFLEKAAEGEHREEALYRLGGILVRLDRFENALAVLSILTGEFPEGKLFHKARFLAADALAGLKRYDEASAVYEKEVSHLISGDRKEEIAKFYLKYADALAAKDREGGPQYENAIELYKRALDLEIPGLIDEEIRFKIAACCHELERYRDEEKVLVEFRKRHPESPSLDEASFRIAEARFADGRLAEARKSYRDFFRDHGDSRRVPEVRYGIALTYHIPEPENPTELSLGVKALDEFLEKSPQHRLAPKARFEMGMAYVNQGRFDEAIEKFKEFLALYGAESDVEQIPDVRYELGACHYSQKNYTAALAAFGEFLREHPAHELWDDAQLMIVICEYDCGLDLLAKKEYEKAREQLLSFCFKYPLDERTPSAYYTLGLLETNRKKHEAAIREWEKLVSKYPVTDLASAAQFNIGDLYEKKIIDLEAALEAYKKVTFGPYEKEAKARIRAMKAETLKVVVERTFNSSEAPKVKVTTRNIEEVSMRVYRIDLEDYFVKRSTIRSVEDLDIDLIEPDKKWSAPVEGFKKYAEISREVELPFSAPGAWVLNVSDEKRTATALVLVTDLQMILKSGREDVLVFVEDVRRKESFEGAEVIVSNGSKVLFRGETGKDGVFHRTDKSLRSTDLLSVLVSHEGSFASNLFSGMSKMVTVEGLVPKAFLFTDRTIYKPGHDVHVKGFVREVKEGRYTFSEGGGYELTLYSPGGRAVACRSVELDPFGAVDEDFNLSGSAPYGYYRIELKARSGWSESLTFTVGEYVPPKVTARVDLPADVYYQGETVKGAFKVFYNYGEPASGKVVRYSWGTGVTLEGTVNKKGEVPFEIDTRDFAGSGEYLLTARVLGESATAKKVLHLSDTGFSLDVVLSRDVILSGEQVSVDIKARKPNGKPSPAEAELRVIFLEEKEGVTTEREVRRIEGLFADKETGRAVTAVALDRGGYYRLRAAASDRFGNLITAEEDLFVSGEEDKVKLRIFADAASYDAGAKTDVRVHMRCDSGLALLTCEGERIFHYEVRSLEKGDNKVPLSVAAGLAPNFTFAAAVMDGHKFHKAEIDLDVRSSLNVLLEPESAEVKPGGKMKVRITALDRMGRPVEGQFALAAVDNALLSMFPEEREPIHEFFFGRRREGRLKTASSCTFEYKARTMEIDEALRREEKLRELRKMESKQLALAEKEIIDGAVNDVIGIGGGAGGSFGGKYSKRKSTKGGGATMPGPRGAVTGGLARKRYAGENKDKRAPNLGGPDLESLKSLGYNGGSEGKEAFRMVSGTAGFLTEHGRKETASVSDGADWALGDRAEFAKQWKTSPKPAVRKRFLDTAWWAPAVVTGPDGRAEVEIEFPHNTTTWRLLARGLTKETKGGRAESRIVARKGFFAEVRAPGSLIEGDEISITARLVNTTEKKLSIIAALRLTGPAEALGAIVKKTGIEPGAIEEIDFRIKAAEPGFVNIRFEADAGSAGISDTVESSLLVKPMGMEVTAGNGGTAGSSHTVKASLPDDKTYTHSGMEITVGPTFSDTLLHMAKEGRRFCCLPTYADRASRVLVKLSALDYLRRSGHDRPSDRKKLAKDVESLISFLLLAQNNDGGFPWVEKGTVSPLATAQAMKALALASKRGFAVSGKALASTAEWLDRHSRKTADSGKAFFLHAYSHHRKPEFTFLNSLFRNRHNLSDHDTALLALTFIKSGHKDNAATLVKMLIDRSREGDPPWTGFLRSSAKEAECVWLDNDAMTIAHATLAVALVEPSHPVVKRGIDSLMKNGYIHRRTGPANAAAAAAISEYMSSANLADNRYRLDVAVNGKPVKTLEVAGSHPVTSIPVPADVLLRGENKVAFSFNGRGAYTWAVKMTGFTKEMAPRKYKVAGVAVERKYLMAPILYKGREISSGFRTVELPRGFKKWEHELEEINEGETARIRLEWYNRRTPRREALYPLVITDTLPAGCNVIESGIKGSFDHYELGPGTITFYVRSSHSSVTYPVYASFRGDCRTPPAVVRSVYDPAVCNNSKAFAMPIRERGAEKTVPYRMTPDELFNLGEALYKDEDWTRALDLLEKFLDEYKPRENYLVDTATKLFKIAFRKGDDARLIRYFELLRTRAPSLVLTFHETARVGTAYRARGEHEQALQIFAAAAGSSFSREARVADALERQGETAGSLMFLADLIHTYPDLPAVQSAFFALSQTVLDKAGPAGGRPGIPGLSRKKIMAAAVDLVIDFLATYPDNRICDEAAYSLVSTLLDMEKGKEVARLCPLFRERWPKSSFLRSMEYAEAYALFEIGRYDGARALLKRVADLDPAKLDPQERDNRNLAIYIMGQIEHAGGRIAEALEQYNRVKGKFADAAEAVEGFTRPEVSLEEISTFRSGQEVKVTLSYRNVPEVTLSVYKVDLMKLCLLRKSLNNITNINLAGIDPTLVEKIVLGGGKDYREMKKELKLPLGEKGAYLAVVQGEGAGCTGMVLVTDLGLEVDEDAPSGRVRINVRDKDTDAFLKNIYVKVIGARQTFFVTGYTDLRGVFIADGIHGESTVIAEREGEYAFHRGRMNLLERPRRPSQKAGREMFYKGRSRALQNIFDQNRQMQQRGVQTLQDLYQEDVQGVQIK